MNPLEDFEYEFVSGKVSEKGKKGVCMPVRMFSVTRKSRPGLHGYGLDGSEALIDLLRREENEEIITTG